MFSIFNQGALKRLSVLLMAALLVTVVNAQKPSKKYTLVTDLADTCAIVKSLGMLLNDLAVYPVNNMREQEVTGRKDGLVILLSDEKKAPDCIRLIKDYTRNGGTIVMDIKAFAALNGIKTKSANAKAIFVKEESGITKGYKKDEPIIYSNNGKLIVLADYPKKQGITVLGTNQEGDAGLVVQKKGKGKIVATDMLSLEEPTVYAGTENKYLFMVNAIGNGVRFGKHFPHKLTYPQFVSSLKDLAEKYPSIKLQEEGDATGGNKIYSLSMGDPSRPGIMIYSNTHGNEWENSYGTLNFITYLSEHPDQNIIDLGKFYLKVIPLLNPYGYEHMTRQNGNKVDLNRNGNNRWDQFTGQDPANYKVGEYDWKGTAPFSEPEARTLKKAAESANYLAFLDIHGNPSGTGYNKSLSVASSTKTDAYEKGLLFKETFNQAVSGRYILKQSREKIIKPFVIENMYRDEKNPLLYITLSKDKYGYLVELLCGYNSTQFISMQDDLVTELCVAFCKTFAN